MISFLTSKEALTQQIVNLIIISAKTVRDTDTFAFRANEAESDNALGATVMRAYTSDDSYWKSDQECVESIRDHLGFLDTKDLRNKYDPDSTKLWPELLFDYFPNIRSLQNPLGFPPSVAKAVPKVLEDSSDSEVALGTMSELSESCWNLNHIGANAHRSETCKGFARCGFEVQT